MNEEWKVIEQAPNYKVSNLGKVINMQTGKALKSYFNNERGNLTVCLTVGSKRKTFSLAKTVAKAFLPNPSSSKKVKFIDGDKTNVCVDNIAWMKANLTEVQVKEIISKYSKGQTLLSMVGQFPECTINDLYSISSFRTWRGIPRPKPMKGWENFV